MKTSGSVCQAEERAHGKGCDETAQSSLGLSVAQKCWKRRLEEERTRDRKGPDRMKSKLSLNFILRAMGNL